MGRFSFTPIEWENTYYYKSWREEDTKKLYEELQSLVEHLLGRFPSAVIQGVSYIVLWILKSPDCFMTPIDKREEIEKLLNPIADKMFEQLLLIGERITYYSIQDSVGYYEDQPITTMENRVAYNLLIRVYKDGPWLRPQPPTVHRKKAYEMLLILKNESLNPIHTQRKMIDDLLFGIADHIYCDLLVFIISKLFPDFVRRWKGLFMVIPATSFARSSRASKIEEIIEGSGSGSGEEDHHPKVVDTLLTFSWIVFHSLRYWDDDDEAAEKEEYSGGFKESENELRCGASPPRDQSDHPQLSLSRNGRDRSVAGGKENHKGSSKHKRREGSSKRVS